jgi:hypothetical protein
MGHVLLPPVGGGPLGIHIKGGWEGPLLTKGCILVYSVFMWVPWGYHKGGCHGAKVSLMISVYVGFNSWGLASSGYLAKLNMLSNSTCNSKRDNTPINGTLKNITSFQKWTSIYSKPLHSQKVCWKYPAQPHTPILIWPLVYHQSCK